MTKAIATLNDFLARLERRPAAKLVFSSEGKEINPDYHVTELKKAEISSIDCGREQSEWTETTVQLLDGPRRQQGDHMSAEKFSQIANASLRVLPDLGDSDLWFEYAPGNAAARKYTIRSLQETDDQFVVLLGGRAAACKPAQKRAELGAAGRANQCCGGAQTAAAACCA